MSDRAKELLHDFRNIVERINEEFGSECHRFDLYSVLGELYARVGDKESAKAALECAIGPYRYEGHHEGLVRVIDALSAAWPYLHMDRPTIAWTRIIDVLDDLLTDDYLPAFRESHSVYAILFQKAAQRIAYTTPTK